MFDLPLDFDFAAESVKSSLPATPSPDVSDRYMFIDSRKVVDDMRDLGYEVANFRRPRTRSIGGVYGLHEIDFRKPEHIHPKALTTEVPRVLFLNSYDGSRRAQIIGGIFRLVCLNGLLAGEAKFNDKFLHLGDYESELLSHLQEAAGVTGQLYDSLEAMKGYALSNSERLDLAGRSLEVYRDVTKTPLTVKPFTLLQPRRKDDVKTDLWTTFNVIQENLLRGGLPAYNADGSRKILRPLVRIERSNQVNRRLWDTVEEFAGL